MFGTSLGYLVRRMQDPGSRIQDTEYSRAMSYNHCLRTFDKRKKRDNFNKTK